MKKVQIDFIHPDQIWILIGVITQWGNKYSI